MRPLAPLAPHSTVERLLLGGAPEGARAEMDRLEGVVSSAAERAALRFARGELALRTGQLHLAGTELSAAAEAFAACGEAQASALARCESLVAETRRGPRQHLPELIARIAAVGRAAGEDALVRATASTVLGAAYVAAGQPEQALDAFAVAVAASDDLLPERVRVLNSMGTLYGVLGAQGAAASVLEHAAELARRLGLVESEAIARGQLGSLALARGDLDAARAHLGAQELLATRLGDRHGRARALAFLAEVALDAGQAEAARDLAANGKEIAEGAAPPLSVFAAFAERIGHRARRMLGEPPSRQEVDTLRDRFRALGVGLGAALVDADAALDSSAEDERALRLRAMDALASLGLTQRVTELLRAARAGEDGDDTEADLVIAAVAQPHAHVADAHEVDLVFSAPRSLAAIGKRRVAAQRNLAKLAALWARGPGLTLAVCALPAGAAPAPPPGARAALVGALGSVAVWAWPLDTSESLLREELVRVDPRVKAVIARAPEARIATVPFAGEPSASMAGVDVAPWVERLKAVTEGSIEPSPAGLGRA